MRCQTERANRERGFALMVAMMALVFMTALGLALIATTSSEATIAAHFRSSAEAFYAAEAAAERAIADLRRTEDWTTVLDGSVRSSFVDGAPGGTRRLMDGSAVDLTKVVNLVNCRKTTACRDSDMNAVTSERPWGINNPRWQLYAYGDLNRLLPPSSTSSAFYVLVLAADDPSDNDGNPLQDGGGADNPGAGVIALRAEAFGPLSAHAVVEITVAHPEGLPLRSWRQVR